MTEIIQVGRREQIAIIACPSMKNRRESLFFSFIDRVFPFWSVTRPSLHLTRSAYFALASIGFIKEYERLTGDEIKFFSDIHDNGISTIASKVARDDLDAVYQFTATEEQYKFVSENYMLRRQCIIHRKPLLINSAAYSWEIFKWIAAQGCWGNPHFLDPADMQGFVESIVEQDAAQFLFGKQICALIAHNKMKDEMLAFARQNSGIINQFGEVVATRTTGTLLNDNVRSLKPVFRYNSGPEGGDAQIVEATHGKTGVILFLQDPANPHPHQADIESCVKGISIPESKLSMLHDSATAMSIFENMQKFMMQSQIWTMRPVLVAEALEKLFKVNIILSDRSGQAGLDDTVTQVAWYFLKSISERQKKTGQVSVCVPWGTLSHAIVDSLEKCRAEVEGYRGKCCINAIGQKVDLNVETLTEGVVNLADDYLSRMRIPRATFSPMTGIVGFTDHGLDANLSVKRFARFFSGRANEISCFAFADRDFVDRNRDYEQDVGRQWDDVDYALFSCEGMARRDDDPFHHLAMHQEMLGAGAVGEICGGIYLTAEGDEVASCRYRRIGISLEQLRKVKEGAFCIVADPALTDTVRAALRSGAVSHLFTTRELAVSLIEAEIGGKRLSRDAVDDHGFGFEAAKVALS